MFYSDFHNFKSRKTIIFKIFINLWNNEYLTLNGSLGKHGKQVVQYQPQYY